MTFEEWVNRPMYQGYRGAFEECWLASRKAALEEAAAEVYGRNHECAADIHDAILALANRPGEG